MSFDPYKVLKVDPSADDEVISAAYRALSKKYHPDLNKTPDAQAQMRLVNQAYDLLKDPQSRARVDADIARRGQTGPTQPPPAQHHYRQHTTGTSRPSSPPPSTGYQSGYGTGTQPFSNSRGAERPNYPEPNAFTLYMYQKRLVDDAQKKNLRIAVYHDRQYGKVCNISASGPDAAGRITTGSVFLQNLEMFDLTDAVNEALAVIQKTNEPIEMNQDHDVYFRRKISGLSNTYIAVEVIKPVRLGAKQALILIGERRGEGVVSTQTEKQMQQIDKILTEAFATMR